MESARLILTKINDTVTSCQLDKDRQLPLLAEVIAYTEGRHDRVGHYSVPAIRSVFTYRAWYELGLCTMQ